MTFIVNPKINSIKYVFYITDKESDSMVYSDIGIRITDADEYPKRRGGVGVNGSWSRNKQKAFTFVISKADTTFVLFQAMRQSGWKLTFWPPFLVSFLWRDKEMEEKKNIIEK